MNKSFYVLIDIALGPTVMTLMVLSIPFTACTVYIFCFPFAVSLATSSNVNITVMKGQTLHLTCPIAKQSQGTPVEWKNPDGNIMFFNMIKGENGTAHVVLSQIRMSSYHLFSASP